MQQLKDDGFFNVLKKLDNRTPEEKNKDYETYQAEVEKQREQDRLIELEDMKRKYIISCFGERFVDCNFDNYIISNEKQKKVVDICKQYINESKTKGESLLLYGNSGTGKNHLIVSMCTQFKDFKVINFEQISEKKRQLQFKNSDWQGYIKDYRESKMLIFPDLILKKNNTSGIMELTESQKELLYYIIDYRYNNYLPVIIATNVTLTVLKKGIDSEGSERITDRISEMVGKRLCLMDWESFRKK